MRESSRGTTLPRGIRSRLFAGQAWFYLLMGVLCGVAGVAAAGDDRPGHVAASVLLLLLSALVSAIFLVIFASSYHLDRGRLTLTCGRVRLRSYSVEDMKRLVVSSDFRSFPFLSMRVDVDTASLRTLWRRWTLPLGDGDQVLALTELVGLDRACEWATHLGLEVVQVSRRDGSITRCARDERRAAS